ncbi:MAG: hypothetical protein M3Z22_07905, partial [Verrucomicrobiota bacterium]|nr:hypothetical protein [Verrucomicrobiota bacterium]
MRRLRLRTLRWLALLLFFALFAGIVMRWISLERWQWAVEHTTETSRPREPLTPSPEPTPPRPKV